MYRGRKGYLVSAYQGKNLLDLYTLRRQRASGKWVLNREFGESLEIVDDKAAAGSIQACEVVLDERTGTRNLFLVLSQPQGPLVSTSGWRTTTVYRLLTYSPSRRKLLHYGEEEALGLAAISAEDPPVSKISILDGPIVVWTEGCQLQVMHSDSDHSNKILRQTYNLENLISDHFRLVKVIDLWPFSWTDETLNSVSIECSSLFIAFLKLKVAAEATSSNDHSITVWVCLQVKLSRSPQGLSVKLLRESTLIPRDYGCISTCVALHRSYCAGLSSGDIGSKNRFLVGTEYRQVVLLHEGRPLQCVPLKFTPCEISLLSNGTGQLSFGCRSNSGEASAFKIDEDGVQECGEWEGVRHLVVGDFARLGHDQLLLLFKDPDSELDFHVTDLEQFSTTDKEGEKEEGPAGQQCAESLISVMNALNLQKSNSEAYLTGIKTELQLKSELVRKSLSFMKSLEQKRGGGGEPSSVSTPRSSDPSLVCIIPGEINVRGPSAVNWAEPGGRGSSQQLPPLKLVNLWQRLKSGQWVIGTVVHNQSSKVLKGVRFSIAPVRGQQACSLDCSSRVIWIEQSERSSKQSAFSSQSTSSPPAKKRKIEQPPHDLLQGLLEGDRENEQSCVDTLMLEPETRMCVVLSTGLPVMQTSCGEQSVAIIANWIGAEMAGETQRSSKCCHHEEEVAEIGAATLSCQLLCSGELNLIESCLLCWDGRTLLPQDVNLNEKVHQDLACILGTSSFIVIEARSHHTSLLSLPAMLKGRLPLQSSAIITTGGCQVNTNNSADRRDSTIRGDSGSCSLEALEGVAIHVTPTANSARIVVLFRSIHHLSLLLVSMRQCLPQDVNLQLLKGAGYSWVQSLRGCLTCILDEAKGECEEMEHRVRGGGEADDGSSQGVAMEGLTELRDRTDQTISTANRNNC